jgi:hypothetical protein
MCNCHDSTATGQAVIRVKYDLNGQAREEAEENLRNSISSAISDGLLDGLFGNLVIADYDVSFTDGLETGCLERGCHEDDEEEEEHRCA